MIETVIVWLWSHLMIATGAVSTGAQIKLFIRVIVAICAVWAFVVSDWLMFAFLGASLIIEFVIDPLDK